MLATPALDLSITGSLAHKLFMLLIILTRLAVNLIV